MEDNALPPSKETGRAIQLTTLYQWAIGITFFICTGIAIYNLSTSPSLADQINAISKRDSILYASQFVSIPKAQLDTLQMMANLFQQMAANSNAQGSMNSSMPREQMNSGYEQPKNSAQNVEEAQKHPALSPKTTLPAPVSNIPVKAIDLTGVFKNSDSKSKWKITQSGAEVSIEVLRSDNKKKGDAIGYVSGNYLVITSYVTKGGWKHHGALSILDKGKVLRGDLMLEDLGTPVSFDLEKQTSE